MADSTQIIMTPTHESRSQGRKNRREQKYRIVMVPRQLPKFQKILAIISCRVYLSSFLVHVKRRA
jgi:hypothetical protein